MKKLIPKLFLLLVPVLIYYIVVYITAPFNVFHYCHVRVTGAADNSNYIKTRYVVEHPDRYNAFVIGSSRVANIPEEGLPKELSGTELSWYNLETAMASVKDGCEALKSLLDHGVDVKYVVLGIDEVSMWRTYDQSCSELMGMPYQKYEENPLKFYYEYLKVKPQLKQFMKVFNQTDKDKKTTEMFYEYGVQLPNTDTSVPAKKDHMMEPLGCGEYTSSEPPQECIQALTEIRDICESNGIELVVYTSPVHGATYREAASKGYLDFLVDAAEVVDYYNFSGINEYTDDQTYYFDNSHFVPYVGLKMEEVMFSGARNEDVTAFGAYITSAGSAELVKHLEGQLE